MSLSPGSRLGVYQLLGHLGTGGMGEVYRAHDPRLGRDVALKILPPDMSNDPARLERFSREARAIAALNHPHIVTIYSTEETDGIRFLTMELVEGQALDALIPPAGLPVSRFLEVAVPLADALTAAHQKQITHRDLKPANVMVAHDGRVKVLDFGLAKTGATGASGAAGAAGATGATGAAGATRETMPQLTAEGSIIGTMPYMSPEQIEGKALDHRTDLFSLGVMFHEMLVGARPFTGDSSPQLMSSILRDTPRSATEVRPEIPEGLSRLIHRCLEKRPEDRVQTARDVYNELRHVQKQIESGPVRRPDSGGAARLASSLWIAVLPFTTRGTDPDAPTLAAGLTEDITAGLARFESLSLIAPQSAASFKDSALDVRQVAERLGARFIIGGSVRRSVSGIRVAAHLTDAESGAQLWTDTYDYGARTDIYAVLDDVTDRVVATLADVAGVLARSLARATQGIPVDRLSARQLIHRCWGFHQRPGPIEHGELRGAVEAAILREPENPELLSELSLLYLVEYALLLNPQTDPLDRASRAARRAIEINPVSQGGWLGLALASYFARDEAGFFEAADRVTKLNPRNAYAVSWIGALFGHKGEYDRGLPIVERCMALNPSHSGTYHFTPFNAHFARGEYQEALKAARRVNVADFMWMHLAIAAAAGHLGLAADGKAAVAAVERLAPPLADPNTLREFVSRWYWDEDFVDRLLDGVARARGSTSGSAATPAPPVHRSTDSMIRTAARKVVAFRESSVTPVREGAASARPPDSAAGLAADAFVVTVIPFAAAAGSDAAELADGLTQATAVGLSRFSYLRAVTRNVTADSITTGYVLTGSVRMAGGVVRVVVQLTAAATGQNLWAETYDRKSDAVSLFDMQDEIAEKIVATIADVNGALVRAISAVVRHRPAESLTPYEAVLRALAYIALMSPEEHAALTRALELAVERAPSYADAWAALAFIYSEELAQSFNERPGTLERVRSAVRRALELDPSNQLAHFAQCRVGYFTRDMSMFRAAADRVIAINPLATHALSFVGTAKAYAGDWEGGLALVERAMALNPHHAGIYHMPYVMDRYRRRDYAGALEILDRVNMPGYPNVMLARAAVYAQLGRLDEAAAVWREADARVPGYGARLHAELTKWFSPEHVAHIEEAVAKILRHAPLNPTPRTSELATPGTSIAVLPFTDLSAEKNQDWFCDGVAEEILNALTALPGLRVAARASAFSFRQQSHDLEEIATKLRVATVLQGSVRRAGDRVRVTVQLVDATNGFQLWSDRYDRELRDIFDVQDEIARAVADRLKVTLALGDGERLVAKVTGNIEAYELLLKGRTLLTRRGRAILEAMPCFEQAIALDPDLAEAHALLGDAYRLAAVYGIAPAAEVIPKAQAALDRALALDPRQVEALATLANIATIYDWDVATSRRLSDRALECDPNHVRALGERSIALAALASPDPALQQEIFDSVRRARELDPLNAWAVALEGFDLALLERFDEAAAFAEQALALDRENFTARWVQVIALSGSRKFDEALAAAEPALAMSGRSPRILIELAAAHAARGDRAAADAIHEELCTRAQTSYVGHAERAAAAASAGRLDEARQLLARAIAARDTFLTFWKLPSWAPLRADAESMALLRATRLLGDQGS